MLTALLLAATGAAAAQVAGQQWFYIVRHADKFSSYPPCPPLPAAAAAAAGLQLNGTAATGSPCFNESLMGNNPPLTPSCGVQQSEATAGWLVKNASSAGGIQHIVSSNYARSLETALPLARALGLKLQVENLVGEARRVAIADVLSPFLLNAAASKERVAAN